MKTISNSTTIGLAIESVDGFSRVFQTLRQQTALRGGKWKHPEQLHAAHPFARLFYPQTTNL